MEYIGLIFGIFGFFAYCSLSSLRKRVMNLESQISKITGASACKERESLVEIAKSYVGKKVVLDLKEDYVNIDVADGSSKHESNTILDVDDSWLLIRIDDPKGAKIKMIRIEAINTISFCE